MSHGQGTQNMRAVNPNSPEPASSAGVAEPTETTPPANPPRRPRRGLSGAGDFQPIDSRKLYRVDHAQAILGVTRATILKWATDTKREPLPILGPGTAAGFVLGRDIIAYMQRAPRHTKTSRVVAHRAKQRDRQRKPE